MPWWSHQYGLTAHHVGTSARLTVRKAKGLSLTTVGPYDAVVPRISARPTSLRAARSAWTRPTRSQEATYCLTRGPRAIEPNGGTRRTCTPATWTRPV
jgi:hypothetical protein